MKFTAKDSSDYTREHFVWFDGEYLGYTIEDSKFGGQQVKFRVQLDGEDREQWVFATARLTPKTKLGKVLTGWANLNVEAGVEVDIDEVLEPGQPVGIMYGPQEKDPAKTTEIGFRQSPAA